MTRDVYSRGAVRSAAWHFLSGKAASALLTFIILLWLVRLLPVADYGAYVVLIAGTEIGFAFAGLGLPWLAARYLPDYRLNADGRTLARHCLRLLMWQMLALLALAIVAGLGLDIYLRWAGLLGHRDAAWFAVGLLVAEGLGRFLRDGLMAPLMLQGQARISLVLRQVVFLAAVAVLASTGRHEVEFVLAAEFVAAMLAWLVAAIAFIRHLRVLRGQAGEPGWIEPTLGEQWRIAIRMYAAQLISLSYSPQVFLNLVQRSLGTDASALFGFLRTLYEQIARYLPAALLFTVLRPKIIASHLQGGLPALAGLVNLVGKMSLFVLLPLVVLVALGGDAMIALLSGGTFTTGGVFLMGMLLALVPYSQRQLIETVAVAVGRAGLCTFGSGGGLLALPFMLFLLELGAGLWAPVLAMLMGQLVINALMLTGLSRIGYKADWRGAATLAASAFVAWLSATAALLVGHDLIGLLLACSLAGLVFLAMVWRLHVFTSDEFRRFDSVLGRRLFAR